MALFVPDNARPCTVERCFDTINVLIGAKTGLDMSSSYSLGGWPITNSGEAWTLSHSQANENYHMVDEDGERLTTLCVRDIVPQMGGDDIAAVAVRCFSVTCVRGLRYNFHGTYYAQGRAHGMGLKSSLPNDFPRTRSRALGKLYREHIDADPENWQTVQSIASDEHGHWESAAYGISDTDADRTIWEWKTNKEEIGRFATREWALGEAYPVGSGRIFVVEHAANIIYVLEHVPGEGIRHIYTSNASQWYEDAISKAPYALPRQDVEDANTDGSPCGYVDKQGKFYLYHLKGGDLKKLISTNWGNTWGTEATVISGHDLAWSTEVYDEGIQYALAITNSGSLRCYRSSTHFAEATWTQNTNWWEIATGVDTDGAPGAYFSHGWLYCYAFVGGNRTCYKSQNHGQTWTLVS